MMFLIIVALSSYPVVPAFSHSSTLIFQPPRSHNLLSSCNPYIVDSFSEESPKSGLSDLLSGKWPHRESKDDNSDCIHFVSPLLEDSYPPAVLEYEAQHHRFKPLLLYIPGFDGTILAPFLQFPSLGEEFDVRAMKIDNADRSTFVKLKERIVEYLLKECKGRSGGNNCDKVCLMGESFGGILSTEVAIELNKPKYKELIDLKGLVLINPATSYLRSIVYELAPPIAAAKSSIPALEGAEYAFRLLTEVVPLFLGECEHRFLQQLIRIILFKGLPPVVNNAQREAYMGRVAFAIPLRLKFMPKDTFRWRLKEWMEVGSSRFEDRLKALRAARHVKDIVDVDADTQATLKVSEELRTTIVVGELDAMPSVEEAERLSSEMFQNAHVHVVKGSGHISSCGGSLHLIELLREVFPEVNVSGCSGYESCNTSEELHGLEPRFGQGRMDRHAILTLFKPICDTLGHYCSATAFHHPET
eukprot:scaffold8336_cov96-Skeletonema_dohrnii-CCMP3373.AAC.6